MDKISEYCLGEYCFCGRLAVKKIAEVILLDEEQDRHQLSQYVCLEHFDRVMKPYLYKAENNPLVAAILKINLYEELIKSDSVNNLLKQAEKSPSSMGVDNLDNSHSDLYDISNQLRDDTTNKK
jgi:hypothetical protein